jgi:hypothetical protein
VPDTLLLNGGVFRAHALSARLEALLAQWRGAPPRVLHNDAPDIAVARGAVAFALVRSARAGLGPGIGGGAARSHFLVLEDASEASRAICVLPRGTESGVEIALPERRFALRLGQPVRFHLVSSTSDTAWQAGELVDLATDDFIRLPPLTARLPPTSAGRKENVVVRLVATLTEVGTLEMQCVGVDDAERRWQLAFQVRAEAAAPAAAGARRSTNACGSTSPAILPAPRPWRRARRSAHRPVVGAVPAGHPVRAGEQQLERVVDAVAAQRRRPGRSAPTADPLSARRPPRTRRRRPPPRLKRI